MFFKTDKSSSGEIVASQTLSYDGEKRVDDVEALPSTPIAGDQYGNTQRGLKSRHIQLIAIGGAIGTGLFVGTGATLSLTGGANLFMAFVVMSVIIWAVMNSLAEMTTYLPVQGASVPFYIFRFFEPSLAFAAGWNYWYPWPLHLMAGRY